MSRTAGWCERHQCNFMNCRMLHLETQESSQATHVLSRSI
jgi:hypothetical protein